MGCCGDKLNKFSSMNFFLDLFSLEPENSKGNSFIIKKIESQKCDKIIEKTLKEHITESKIIKTEKLGDKFQINI